MSNREDKNMIICTQVISSSLTMITILSAFTVFVLDKREITFLYYPIILLPFIFFVCSIFYGCRGLSRGNDGMIRNPYFNKQALFALLGIVAFVLIPFIGTKNSNELDKKLLEHNNIIIELTTKDRFRDKEIQRLTNELNELTKQINKSFIRDNSLSKVSARDSIDALPQYH